MSRKFFIALFSLCLLSRITSAATLYEVGLSKDPNSLPTWNFTYKDNEIYQIEITSSKLNGMLVSFDMNSEIQELQQIRDYAEKDFSRLIEKHPYSIITSREELDFNGKPLLIYSVAMAKEKDGPKLNTVNYYFFHNNQINYLWV